MYNHFKNIERLYGKNANVRMPDDIFKHLSENIKTKSGKTDIKQTSFAYTYLATIAFLYKYTHFVDVDNQTYIQNSNIKELLGYSKTTKSIDRIIKKDGVLDKLELTSTTRDFPISFITHEEKINGIQIREFITIADVDNTYSNYETIKKIIKNRNYEIKEPLFLTTKYRSSDYGTLYSIEKTHKITINEFVKLIFDENFDNVDFMLYGFFKSMCIGHENNSRFLSLNKITGDIKISMASFYEHLSKLESAKYLHVNHKGWQIKEKNKESNEYMWIGAD